MRIKLLISCVVLLTVALPQNSVEEYFQLNCKVCHSIGGGRLVGPDLLGVEKRADRDWLISWITDPEKLLSSDDAYAQKILQEANNVHMIKSPGITAGMAAKLLDYIKGASGEQAEAYVEPVFTAEDVAAGREIFIGATRLTNGGPPCIACHTVNSFKGLGGGKLGINLTDVYKRLGKSRGLGPWLKAPPTKTMLPVFRDHPFTDSEITSILAFLKHDSEHGHTLLFASSANLFTYGFLGVVLLFALISILWSSRFRAVRIPLVRKAKRQSN